MSELIAVVFKDQYRASEALNDLQRREWDWVGDLDRAVVVRHKEQDKFTVQYSFDPATEEEGAWARLWGSFLSLVLFIPLADAMFDAAKDLSAASGAQKTASIESRHALPDVQWWTESLCVSDEFVRDVGAMIQPGDSAIFALLQTDKPGAIFQQLRNYGGTLLHTTLSPEQDQAMKNVLAFN
ncbi:MAG: DUF1269 domain-containing protein [Acidobacteria bacterium]|nr:DUF1269 domain-containing protein [Acidobacteriota bacterium]